MIDKAKIEEWFIEAVRLSDKPQELKDAIINRDKTNKHIRLNFFLDNLCEEFVKADKVNQRRGVVVKLKNIKETVYQFADVFMHTVEKEAQERMESDLAKSARAAEAEAIRQADDFLAGGDENEYVELGLINGEETITDAEEGEAGATEPA